VKEHPILQHTTQVYFENKKLFDLCGQLFELTQKLTDRINENWNIYSNWSNYKKFLGLLLARNIRAFNGCVMLYNEGHKNDASCLERVVVESFIVLKFLQTNKEQLATKFFEYATVGVNRFFTLNSENPIVRPLKEEFDVLSSDWKKRYEEVKAQYPRENSWSGKNIETMAREGNTLEIYNSIYRFLSDMTHVTDGSLSSFPRKTDSGFAIEPNEDTSTKNAVLGLSFTFFYDILEEVRNEFNIDMKHEFEQIWQEFEIVRDSQMK
jgi:hypothetical protein